MSKLNLKANEVLIFEDSIAGIKAAENSKAQEIIIVNSNNDDYTQWNYQEIVDFSEVDKSLFTGLIPR
jgi:beta-phosphoglucomutase-like phosphatase (HAD superfamily)